MKPYTWEDALSAIREGTQTIPTTPDGVPLVVVNAQYYELMQMMEALTTGYNNLVDRAAEDQKRMERLRKIAQAAFPGDKFAPADGWISVDDMLPPESGEYFTYGSHCRVYPMSYSAKHKLWNAHDCATREAALEHAIPEITHWYPRPQPPVVTAPATEEG